MKNIVITGGAGFIGSHVVRLFVNKYPEYKIINLDKLEFPLESEPFFQNESEPLVHSKLSHLSNRK